jgi:hypothetical protein
VPNPHTRADEVPALRGTWKLASDGGTRSSLFPDPERALSRDSDQRLPPGSRLTRYRGVTEAGQHCIDGPRPEIRQIRSRVPVSHLGTWTDAEPVLGAPLSARTTSEPASALSPIWWSGCQGVGVDSHCLGWWCGWGGMWLRLAGRSGRPRVRDGGHAHIRGLGTPRPCSSHVRCLKSSAAPGGVAQATNRGVVVREPGCSGRLAPLCQARVRQRLLLDY